VYGLSIRDEPVATVPNIVTATRTLLSVALACAALAQQQISMLVAAYLIYWVGDMADGIAARRMGQETRIGAVFDIVADRASTLLCAASCITLRPDAAAPLTVYLVEVGVVDTMLCLGFLAFQVKGPNDMHVVDVTLWRWNWSRPAKATNSALVVLLCLTGQLAAAALLGLVLLAVKLWSCTRLRSLAPPPGLESP
jgi:CDP-diacylglycerol--glycerol-3-phosphate 3-phosphatidyltransferase